MRERLVVEALGATPVAARRVELVERKGTGHPDTICDALVEAISHALSRMYLERAGVILHYNIDKAFLVAGECRKGFGGGKVGRPIEFIVGDRATLALGDPPATTFPVEATVRVAVEAWVERHLPRFRPSEHLRIRLVLAPASAELRAIYRPGEHDPMTVTTATAGSRPPPDT
jgi:S-adenosylmethionine synthetase